MCLCSLCRTLLPKEQEYIFSHNFNLQRPQRTLSCAPNIYLFIFPRLARDLLSIIGNCVHAWMCVCVTERQTQKNVTFSINRWGLFTLPKSTLVLTAQCTVCVRRREKKYYLFATVLCQREFQSHHVTISALKRKHFKNKNTKKKSEFLCISCFAII